jgi:DNA-binding transcriptional LysR family regulator
MPVALALSSTAAVKAAVASGAGPAVLSELAGHRLTRVPVAGVNLRRSLRAVWSGGELPPVGAARDLLAHVSVRLPADGIRHG